MINPILLNMLIRQVKNGNVNIEDTKDEEYKKEVEKHFRI